MSLREVIVIEDHSRQGESIVIEHTGWVNEDARMVYYADDEDALLILADVKSYKGANRYEIHPFGTVILLSIPEGEEFEKKELQLLLEKLKGMSFLHYAKVLADRCTVTNLGLERVFYS
ncbi:hypothetical protein [Shouchella shacheensis]|uniref:hypothetical protein n=1 Tax=Shouchella shacheensis TaxID=1649580 RepID=UPI00073FD676|nr:hypothetical protein [Shouchella shacheensis]